MRKRAAVILMLLVIAGCNKGSSKAEGTYKGKPESEWLKLSDDPDEQKRKAAWEALEFFFDNRAQARMTTALGSKSDPLAMSAAAEYFAIQWPEESLGAMRRSLKQGGSMQAAETHFRAAIRRHGARAKALLPDLQAALAGAQTQGGKDAVQGAIDLIPK
jgi:putative alpha-1,2-mannosidase